MKEIRTLAELLSIHAQGGGGGDGFEAGLTFNLDDNFTISNDAGTISFDDTGLNITNGAFDLSNTDNSIVLDDTGLTLDGDLFDITSEDGSVYISPDDVTIDGGLLTVSNSGDVDFITSAGINMYVIDYFKNMVYNSSFEIFDSSTLTPAYWQGDGVSDPNSNFYGDYSCKLATTEYIEQTSSAYINPAFFDNETARVSFHRKLGQMKLEVYDVTNASNFTLTAEDGSTGTSITFDANSNWQASRVSAGFDPTEHGSCTQLKIKITNVHVSQTGYIDAVMLAPDYSGTLPQIYKDGPRSDGVYGSVQGIVKGTTEPTDTDVLWYDLN